jgi:hypothetical protein
MSAPFHSAPKSCTAQDVNEWLLAIQQKHAELHRKAAGLWQSDQHLAAFAEMSALLQEAFEEVRVISGQLDGESGRPCQGYGLADTLGPAHRPRPTGGRADAVVCTTPG